MALSNQSDLPAFFRPWKVDKKAAKSWKMTYQDWPNPGLGQARFSKKDLMKPAA
jgi:hypothetical protein